MKRHSFHHFLKTEATAAGTPALILDNGRRLNVSYHLRVLNRAAYSQAFRFLSSETGPFTDGTARGEWEDHSGPYTIVPGAEKVIAFSADCHRLALAVDGITGKLGDLLVTGYAYNEVATYPGVLELAMTAGSTTVVDGGKEGFFQTVDGYVPRSAIPGHSFSRTSYYGSTNNIKEVYYYTGPDQVELVGGDYDGIYTARGTSGGQVYYNLVDTADSTTLNAIVYASGTWTLYDGAGDDVATLTSANPWTGDWTGAGAPDSTVGPVEVAGYRYFYAANGAADNDDLIGVRQIA